MANATSKNVGLGKFWQDLEISEAFLISLEVSFFHGLFLLFLSLETFLERVSSSDFELGSRRLGKSRILPFATPKVRRMNQLGTALLYLGRLCRPIRLGLSNRTAKDQLRFIPSSHMC